MTDFNLTNETVPKLTDVLNNSDSYFNISQVFTYAWTEFLGVFFFAFIIGVLGGALFLKTENALVTTVYFMLMGIFFAALLPANFIYIIGIISVFIIGFLLFRIFIKE